MKAPQLAWAWGGLDDRKTAGEVDQDILICRARETLGPPTWLTNDVIFRAPGRSNEKLQANCVRQIQSRGETQ